ncbi:hypothetical protein Tdes44962_MAKER05212 [Teratosphaeria destructans]|uniref:Rhodopsin domain-containing protein n=1 Tax=Teratosphaeria destructans TaxID=418781 RepID=A0A9W7SKE5_9PEZI|nr:hypothetical protein Tdes44962_MAKER05212 [Teratosphaeria destructans]
MPGNIISITPAEVAAWPKPNYIDPFDRTWLSAYAGFLYALSTAFLSLRFWLRITQHSGPWGLDDWILLLAWLCSTMYTVVTIYASATCHVGRHVWDIPIQLFEPLALVTWLAELASLLTGGLCKISVLLFYRRLVVGTYERGWRWAVWIAIALTACYNLAFILALLFNCNPTRAYWMAFDIHWIATRHPYTCADTKAINLLSGICSAVSDLYSVVLPIIMTRKIQLPKRQKIALRAIFCLGLLVVATSAVRSYNLYEVGEQSDVTWYIFNVYAWSQAELQLGLICAGAPSIRVLFRKFFGSMTSRMYGSNRSTEPSNIGTVAEEENVCRRSFGAKNRAFVDSHDRWSTVELAKGSYDTQVVGEIEVDTSLATSHTIKAPEDYELRDMRTLEKYREKATSIGSRRESMSQAGKHHRHVKSAVWNPADGQ